MYKCLCKQSSLNDLRDIILSPKHIQFLSFSLFIWSYFYSIIFFLPLLFTYTHAFIHTFIHTSSVKYKLVHTTTTQQSCNSRGIGLNNFTTVNFYPTETKSHTASFHCPSPMLLLLLLLHPTHTLYFILSSFILSISLSNHLSYSRFLPSAILPISPNLK